MDKTWKSIERKVASYFGGTRVPVTGRQRGDVPDILHPDLSIEVKHRQALPNWILEAMEQAEMSRRDGQTAIVVLHPKGSSIAESLTVMRCSDTIQLLNRIEDLEEACFDLKEQLYFHGGG